MEGNNDFFNLVRPVYTNDLVRLGRNCDGGYLVNRRALQNAGLISFGINDDWSFEKDFSTHSNEQILMYDGSISLEKFKRDYYYAMGDIFSLKFFYAVIRNPAMAKLQVRHIKNAKCLYSSFKDFSGLKQARFRSLFLSNITDATHVTTDDVFTETEEQLSYFMKIDIEGHEYRILEMLVKKQHRITGMVVEFHNLDILFNKFKEQVQQLKEHFYITHIHANNYSPVTPQFCLPGAWEITFINKSMMKGDIHSINAQQYPLSGMDFPNDPGRPDFHFSI
jgi:hypothetical protein